METGAWLGLSVLGRVPGGCGSGGGGAGAPGRRNGPSAGLRGYGPLRDTE